MAHADYDCCAICDCKMNYNGYDSQTKENICTDCLKNLRSEGLNILDVEELKQWVEKTDKNRVKDVFDKLGYKACFYGNDFDEFIANSLKTVLLIILLIPFAASSQNIGAGISAGYSSKQAATIELTTGIKLSNSVNLYPVNIKAHLSSDIDKPAIIESRLAYQLRTWEVYGGYGFHISSMDNKAIRTCYGGFRPAYGLIKHFGKIAFNAGMSGDIFTAGVGLLGYK